MTEPNQTDILGRPLEDHERELLEIYERLKKLSADDSLPPCATANARQAMVMLWNACNDLDLVYEEPGVD